MPAWHDAHTTRQRPRRRRYTRTGMAEITPEALDLAEWYPLGLCHKHSSVNFPVELDHRSSSRCFRCRMCRISDFLRSVAHQPTRHASRAPASPDPVAFATWGSRRNRRKIYGKGEHQENPINGYTDF